jgi:NhaA family Na+:H+ antiporter
MAVFFMMVGLEIKRELVTGQLATWSQRALPGFAALGGLAVPALIYVGFNAGHDETLSGWAIPAARILLLRSVYSPYWAVVPVSLKIFLSALAILDDMGAVAIIALFYTSNISLLMLGGAAAMVALLFSLNRAGVTRLLPYLLTGEYCGFSCFSQACMPPSRVSCWRSLSRCEPGMRLMKCLWTGLSMPSTPGSRL